MDTGHARARRWRHASRPSSAGQVRHPLVEQPVGTKYGTRCSTSTELAKVVATRARAAYLWRGPPIPRLSPLHRPCTHGKCQSHARASSNPCRLCPSLKPQFSQPPLLGMLASVEHFPPTSPSHATLLLASTEPAITNAPVVAPTRYSPRLKPMGTPPQLPSPAALPPALPRAIARDKSNHSAS